MSDSHIYDRVEDGLGGFRWIVTKAGKRMSIYDVESQAKRGLTTLWRSLARMGKLARKDAEMGRDDWERIDWLLDEVDTMLSIWREQVRKHGVRRTAEERIAQLREVAGRTPEEAAAYRAKADELERAL